MRGAPFTEQEAYRAAERFGFNCGPAALCAVTGLRPEEAIDRLHGFERKRYTNPSMMQRALRDLGIGFERVYQCLGLSKAREPKYPEFGLVRVQWGGPWTEPGVPVRARYSHTHWIACDRGEVFDVNAISWGGWIARWEWEQRLVPWLLEQVEPKASGEWWPTHCWQVLLS